MYLQGYTTLHQCKRLSMTTTILAILIILTQLSCTDSFSNSQAKKNSGEFNIKPFKVEIINSNYSMAYSVITILTNEQLQIIFRGGIIGEKDSVLFSNLFSLLTHCNRLAKSISMT